MKYQLKEKTLKSSQVKTLDKKCRQNNFLEETKKKKNELMGRKHKKFHTTQLCTYTEHLNI